MYVFGSDWTIEEPKVVTTKTFKMVGAVIFCFMLELNI